MPPFSRRTVRSLVSRSRSNRDGDETAESPASEVDIVDQGPTETAQLESVSVPASPSTMQPHESSGQPSLTTASSFSSPPTSLPSRASQEIGPILAPVAIMSEDQAINAALLTDEQISQLGLDESFENNYTFASGSGQDQANDASASFDGGLFTLPPLSQLQPQADAEDIFAANAVPRSHEAYERGMLPNHVLPGNDRFPLPPTASRPVDGSWLGGNFERFTVGDRTFLCPVHLLLRYPHWRFLLSLERPPHGWFLAATVDPVVFGLLMETVISPTGFDGTEPGLNLVKLALAACQAHEWGMDLEVAKLAASLRLYVARRIFFRNPHVSDRAGVMDSNYFAFRSEEIYRTWRAVSHFPAELRAKLPAPAELVCLYALVIPRELWPAVTADFVGADEGDGDEFCRLVDLAARVRVLPESADYHDWWLRCFRRAGCLDFDWLADVPGVMGMFVRNAQNNVAADT